MISTFMVIVLSDIYIYIQTLLLFFLGCGGVGSSPGHFKNTVN